MKILRAIPFLPSLLLLPLPAMASNPCDFDYNANLYVGYSKGHFDIENQNDDETFSKTHNNASTLGGGLVYKCGETTLKYTYVAGIDLSDTTFHASRLINTLSLMNDHYGSLLIGQMTTPYKAAGKNGDPFWDTAAGTVKAGNNFGFSDMTRGFTPNSIVYTTPGIGNIYLNVGYTGTNSQGDIHEGIEYKTSNSVLGVQYVNMGETSYIANSNGSKEAVRLYGRQTFSSWSLSGSIENVSKESGVKENFYNVSLQKKIVDFGRFALSYGQISDARLKLINGSIHEGDGAGLSAGGFYNLTSNGEVYLLTSLLKFSENTKQKSAILGFKYNFSM